LNWSINAIYFQSELKIRYICATLFGADGPGSPGPLKKGMPCEPATVPAAVIPENSAVLIEMSEEMPGSFKEDRIHCH